MNQETSNLLRQSGDAANQEYLTKNTNDAVRLIRCVENRQSTMERLMKEILQYQQGFFLRGEPLRAMTMGDLAGTAGAEYLYRKPCGSGTRALQFQGRSIPLRDLFTVKLTTPQGEDLSSAAVKRHISRLIQEETPSKPFSDEQLRCALEALGIVISRRTVAKYREELGIPGSSQRRQKAGR